MDRREKGSGMPSNACQMEDEALAGASPVNSLELGVLSSMENNALEGLPLNEEAAVGFRFTTRPTAAIAR